jgi:hypothetical protein
MMENAIIAHTEKETLVEEGTHLKGSLTSSCPIAVRGKVEGDVKAPSLRVSATGALHGSVKANEIVSEGELSGEFDAEVIRLSGVVKDNTVLRARSLQVKLVPAAGRVEVVFGACQLEVGEMPDQEAAVSAARGNSRPPAEPEPMTRVASERPPAAGPADASPSFFEPGPKRTSVTPAKHP